MKKILVVCTGNSCRSQMMEAWIRKFAGDKVQVFSAGTKPENVNTKAIHVMKLSGIEISHHKSNLVDEVINMDLDFVITVCDQANENCPYFPTVAKKIHKSFPDPAKAKGTETEILTVYRDVRDSLKEFAMDFVEKELGILVRKEILSWFEIPVLDFNRAMQFYQNVMEIKIQELEFAGIQHSYGGVNGAIVKGEGEPSNKGTLLYFNGGEDLNKYLKNVEKQGGEILKEKTLISDDIGYFALFLDTEGNRLGIWSKN